MEKAIYYFNLAAEQGNPMAQLKFGCIYLEDEGVYQWIMRKLTLFQIISRGRKLD